MRVAIIGSREYAYPEIIREYVSTLPKHTVVVSGGAKGADSWGEQYAKEFGLETKIYLPNWNLFGKRAGFIRNKDIVDNCDSVCCFWNGASRGSLDSMKKALDTHKPIRLYLNNTMVVDFNYDKE